MNNMNGLNSKRIYFTIVIGCLVFMSHPIFAQSSILGKWKTIDDSSGKPRSVVEIYKNGDSYFGRIIEMYLEPHEDPDPICEDCDPDDDRYNMKVLGMEILRGAQKDDDEYVDGSILDPENGKVYNCKLWIEDGDLKLRGYIAFFFRTQTWKKIE